MKTWMKIGLSLMLCSLYPICSVAGDREDAIKSYKDAMKLIESRRMDKAIPLIKFAAKKGNVDALFYLANKHEAGHYPYFKKNRKLALWYYTRVAKQGNAHVQFKVAMKYQQGVFNFDGSDFYNKSKHELEFVVEPDEKEAFKWYKKAAEQGYAPAQYALGQAYETGNLTPEDMFDEYAHHTLTKDIDLALEWYEEAAKQRHSRAQEAIARITREKRVREDIHAPNRPHGKDEVPEVNRSAGICIAAAGQPIKVIYQKRLELWKQLEEARKVLKTLTEYEPGNELEEDIVKAKIQKLEAEYRDMSARL